MPSADSILQRRSPGFPCVTKEKLQVVQITMSRQQKSRMTSLVIFLNGQLISVSQEVCVCVWGGSSLVEWEFSHCFELFSPVVTRALSL